MAPDFSQDPHGDHKVALGAQPGMDRITYFIKVVLIVESGLESVSDYREI